MIEYKGLKEHKVQCGTCFSLEGYDIIAWEPNNTEDVVISCKSCGQRYATKMKLTKINNVVRKVTNQEDDGE